VTHPRISVSAISSYRNTLADDLELWARHDVRAVGVSAAKLQAHGWDDGVARVAASGRRVANLIGLGPFVLSDRSRWPVQRERLRRSIAAAARLDAGCLVLTTGPAGTLPWEAAADALEAALTPVLADARHEGVSLAIEHTHSLRADVGFVHSLRDAIDLATRLDVGVCVEINACWAERDLAGSIARGADRIRLVQVSDYAIGTRCTPDRLVPGDGDLPLDRVLAALLANGYAGDFDLEIVGPRIDDEGYDDAIPRAVAGLEAILGRLGV